MPRHIYTAYNEPTTPKGYAVIFEEYLLKSNDIVQQSRETTDPVRKESLYNAFLDAAVDFFNETMTGDVKLADGRTVFIPAIEK